MIAYRSQLLDREIVLTERALGVEVGVSWLLTIRTSLPIHGLGLGVSR